MSYSHRVFALGGDDPITGSAYKDIINAGEGIDVINDDKSASGVAGNGGGTDSFYFYTTGADIGFSIIDDDLYVYAKSDADADGNVFDYIVIEDQFSNSDSTIEKLYYEDGTGGLLVADLAELFADHYTYPDDAII
ncbi:MAG: hypothetical protein AAGA50_09365 [Pseudomonadota bacterium]